MWDRHSQSVESPNWTFAADSLIKERLGAVEIRLALDFPPKNHFDVEKLSHERQRA